MHQNTINKTLASPNRAVKLLLLKLRPAPKDVKIESKRLRFEIEIWINLGFESFDKIEWLLREERREGDFVRNWGIFSDPTPFTIATAEGEPTRGGGPDCALGFPFHSRFESFFFFNGRARESD